MAKPIPKTPALDKMLNVKGSSQIIGEFMEWLLNDLGYKFCVYNPHIDRYIPVKFSTEELLAWYFHIDGSQVERDRRALLQWLQDTGPEAGDECH